MSSQMALEILFTYKWVMGSRSRQPPPPKKKPQLPWKIQTYQIHTVKLSYRKQTSTLPRLTRLSLEHPGKFFYLLNHIAKNDNSFQSDNTIKLRIIVEFK